MKSVPVKAPLKMGLQCVTAKEFGCEGAAYMFCFYISKTGARDSTLNLSPSNTFWRGYMNIAHIISNMIKVRPQQSFVRLQLIIFINKSDNYLLD